MSAVAPDAERLLAVVSTLSILGFQVRDVPTGGWWCWSPESARFCPGLADVEAFSRALCDEAKEMQS